MFRVIKIRRKLHGVKRRILLALATLIPLALFFVARDAASHRPLLIGTHRGARTLLISPDGTRLFSLGQGEVEVWDVATRARLGQWQFTGFELLPAPDGARVAMASSPISASANASLVVTNLNGAVRDAASGDVLCRFRDSWPHARDVQDAIQDLKWSADGREIVALTNSAVRRFDARNGHLIERVPYDARNGYTSWQLSPGARVIVATDRKGAHFFDARTGQKTHFWKHPAPATHNSPVAARAFLPGGKWILMQKRNAPNDDTAFFVRVSDGHLAWSKSQITTSFYSFEVCDFSRDGQRVLSLEDAQIVSRQSASGKEIWHMNASTIQNAVLAPDGQFFYSIDVQGTIRRWNVPSS